MSKDLKTALLKFLSEWEGEGEGAAKEPEVKTVKHFYIENGKEGKAPIVKYPFFAQTSGTGRYKICLLEDGRMMYVGDNIMNEVRNVDEEIYIDKVISKEIFIRAVKTCRENASSFLSSI